MPPDKLSIVAHSLIVSRVLYALMGEDFCPRNWLERYMMHC